MRLTQVVVVAAVSFLFTSDVIAVTMDSNQAKVSAVAGADPSHRFMRSYKPVEEDSDDLDVIDETEERGGTSKLQDLARSWGLSYDEIATGTQRLTHDQQIAWTAVVNKAIAKSQKKSRDAYNAAWRKANGYERRL
ncbi:Avirulence (Avh) protein [Phytophthora megakarya]|uniref:RxLR effector protein n=1 Tax=Phytophthora megakarya TaxID=4795 RepID=A0A225UM30_9STRA|nr:Avirulence (Avh) protein [Phytophthora megakarya]